MSMRFSTSNLSQTDATELRAGKNSQGLPCITPEARRYALKELARRAGVSREFFQRWNIQIGPECTTASFGSGPDATIRFVHNRGASFGRLVPGAIPVARAGWLNGSRDRINEPDLVLPFCDSEVDSQLPLYLPASEGGLTCRLDLLSSFLFTLSRVEETFCETFDEHGRFPASASLGLRYEFLERPILDEHGLAFQQALSSLLPGWKPETRALRLKLTHDIDEIGIPFNLRTAIGHSLKRHKPTATARDVLSSFTAAEPTELGLVRRLAVISTSRGLQSAFYWKASLAGPRDSGYDPLHEKVQRVIDLLRERGFELGVHPGYETFADHPRLAGEVERLRRALRVDSPGGRQHYLRWSPETWLDWEACGLSYDSSLGFADRFGFRAGTAFPYRPWSWRDNRELDLIELPLVLMDCTPVKYMKLVREEGLARIKTLIARVQRTGGVFTLLWHNTPLLDPDYAGWYEPILDMLTGAQRFDVPADAEQLW